MRIFRQRAGILRPEKIRFGIELQRVLGNDEPGIRLRSFENPVLFKNPGVENNPAG
jgi:hypothetical protein